jgi:histidinol-phosphate phosphatase family protein
LISHLGENPLSNKPAVFLDRDGTIIEDRGYLEHPSQVEFFVDTLSALQRLTGLFELFIVTNQSGVAKGMISIDDVERVNSYIESVLKKNGIRITETYVCPHERSDNCECIKPKPHFMKKAEKEHNIDLSCSYAIGDHPHDVEFAENVGATGIFVLTGHGGMHRHEMPPTTLVASGIGKATALIIDRG